MQACNFNRAIMQPVLYSLALLFASDGGMASPGTGVPPNSLNVLLDDTMLVARASICHPWCKCDVASSSPVPTKYCTLLAVPHGQPSSDNREARLIRNAGPRYCN